MTNQNMAWLFSGTC